METKILKYETFLTNLAIKWHDAIDSSSISLEVRSIYKNSDGIALGRPYNPGPRMRIPGLKGSSRSFRRKKLHF